MKKFFAFSLVEMLVVVVIIGVTSAVLTPTITKNMKSKQANVKKETLKRNCSESWSADCKLCSNDECTVCVKTCPSNQVKNTPDCSCTPCTTLFGGNCIACTRDACTACKSGYGLSNGSCTSNPCPVGQFSNGTTICKPCLAGTYQNLTGQNACIACPVGKYQHETGKSSCNDCNGASYQDLTGQASCKPCPENHSCTASSKTECAANKGSVEGVKDCSNCPLNCTNCRVPSQCLACNSGYYISSGSCVKCPKGHSCNGSAAVKPCPAGTYQDEEGKDSCKNCSSGTFSKAGSTTACSGCGTGMYLLNTSVGCKYCSSTWAHCSSCTASGCSACETGYRLSGTGCQACSAIHEKCTECNSSGCTKCSGSEHYLSGNTCVGCSNIHSSCVECSGSSCTKCTGNDVYLSSGTCAACSGMANCLTCNGYNQCTKCKDGYYPSGICVACSTIHEQCEKCSAGKCTQCKSPDWTEKNGTCVRTWYCPVLSGDASMIYKPSEHDLAQIGNYCVTLRNIGDSTKLPLPDLASLGVKLIDTSGSKSCDRDNGEKCCWQGITANTNNGTYTTCHESYTFADSRYSGSADYGGCRRTVCNWAAANAICNALTYGNRTWSLPDINTLDTIIRTQISRPCDDVHSNGDTHFTAMCGWANKNVSYNTTVGKVDCAGAAGKAKKGDCRPGCIWSSTYVDKYGAARVRCVQHGEYVGQEGGSVDDSAYVDAYALSVRCVSKMN